MTKRKSSGVSAEPKAALSSSSWSERPTWLDPDTSVIAAIADGTAYQDTRAADQEHHRNLLAARQSMNIAIAGFSRLCEVKREPRDRMMAARRQVEVTMRSPRPGRHDRSPMYRRVDGAIAAALAWAAAANRWLGIDRRMDGLRRQMLATRTKTFRAKRTLQAERHFKSGKLDAAGPERRPRAIVLDS